MAADCLFCRVARRELDANIAYQDDDVTAFHDINPQAPTHILLVPNEHVAGVDALTDAQLRLVGRLFSVARDLARSQGVAADGYRLVVNNGPGAGQSVEHLHLHLLGGRAMRWPPG